jgi:hypothetical protein
VNASSTASTIPSPDVVFISTVYDIIIIINSMRTLFNIVQHCSHRAYTLLLISIVLTMQIKTKLNARKMAITIIAAAILATAPLLLSLQIANAANTSTVSGSGNSGQVTCPSGQQVVTMWGINGFKSRGSVSGSWTIDTASGDSGGGFTSGTIAKNHFSLSGTVFGDNICFLPTPTTVTFTGDCSTGATVQFKAGNGESGILIGNVACKLK